MHREWRRVGGVSVGGSGQVPGPVSERRWPLDEALGSGPSGELGVPSLHPSGGTETSAPEAQ